MSKELINLEILNLHNKDYLYPGISDEDEAYYDGYNNMISNIAERDIYELSEAKNIEQIWSILSIHEIDVERNIYPNDEISYKYDCGANEALSAIVSKLKEFLD